MLEVAMGVILNPHGEVEGTKGQQEMAPKRR